MKDSTLPMKTPKQRPARNKESGKLGVAVLMWFLGVPGFIILLYLLFAH